MSFTPSPNIGESRDRELLQHAETYCYKESEQGPLHAHIFHPEHTENGSPRTLLIFFHGGFWDMPAATQFATQCLHFARLGCSCMMAETRVQSRHSTGPMEAIEDSQALILSVKKHANDLGISPDKIVLIGAAGGAFLALQAAMNAEVFMEGATDPRPAAVICLSALVNTTPGTEYAARFPDAATAKSISPSKLIRKKLPPMLFLHGKADKITPLSEVTSFRRWMKWKNNKIEVIEYEGAEHRFFNFNFSHVHHDLSLQAMQNFLIDLNLLEVPVDEF